MPCCGPLLRPQSVPLASARQWLQARRSRVCSPSLRLRPFASVGLSGGPVRQHQTSWVYTTTRVEDSLDQCSRSAAPDSVLARATAGRFGAAASLARAFGGRACDDTLEEVRKLAVLVEGTGPHG